MKFKEAEITEKDSLLLTMSLLRVAIFNISYNRGLFPAKYFIDKSVPALDMQIKKLMPMDSESRWLIDLMEKGVYDALHRKYLETLVFCICETVDGPIIEEYTFSFSYSDSGSQYVMMNINRTGDKIHEGAFTSTADSTRYQVKVAACKLVRTLVQMMQTLGKIPDKRTIVMKLLYYDDLMPPDYEPPFFRGCREEEGQYLWTKYPLRVEIGNVKSKPLVLTVKVKSVLDPCDDEMMQDDRTSIGPDSVHGDQTSDSDSDVKNPMRVEIGNNKSKPLVLTVKSVLDPCDDEMMQDDRTSIGPDSVHGDQTSDSDSDVKNPMRVEIGNVKSKPLVLTVKSVLDPCDDEIQDDRTSIGPDSVHDDQPSDSDSDETVDTCADENDEMQDDRKNIGPYSVHDDQTSDSDSEEMVCKTAPCAAVTEKRPNRFHGCFSVFFQLFDRSRQAKQNFYSRKSLLHGKQVSKRFGGNEKMLKSMLEMRSPSISACLRKDRTELYSSIGHANTDFMSLDYVLDATFSNISGQMRLPISMDETMGIRIDEVVGIEMKNWMDLETHLAEIASEMANDILVGLVSELITYLFFYIS